MSAVESVVDDSSCIIGSRNDNAAENKYITASRYIILIILFPEPVAEQASTSRPASTAGITCIWTGVSWAMSAETRFSCTEKNQ